MRPLKEEEQLARTEWVRQGGAGSSPPFSGLASRQSLPKLLHSPVKEVVVALLNLGQRARD